MSLFIYELLVIVNRLHSIQSSCEPEISPVYVTAQPQIPPR